jgi:Terminase small subunit
MPALRNRRQESFAQLVALGTISLSEAYRRAGFSPTSAHQNASRLRDNEIVQARITELQAQEQAQRQLDRDEMVAILVSFIRNEALSVWPHRVKSAELLAKISHWMEAPKNERIVGDPLQALIDSIRARVVDAPVIKQLPSS